MTQEETDSLDKKIKSYRNWLIITVPFALFGCFVIGIIAVSIFNEFVLDKKVRLSDNVDTIAKFAQEMPAPEKIEIAKRNECEYFFVVGSSRIFLASGVPIYIFDKRGNLIMEISDSGDVSEEHPWWRYYNKATRIKEVSLQEAIEISSENNQ